MSRLLVLLASALLAAAPVAAQPPAAPPGTPADSLLPAPDGRSPAPESEEPGPRGEDLTVYLVTMGPGDLVWEKFGHNAIAIRDFRTGEVTAWNWGIFDFDEADFLPRFIRGEMRYWMAAMDARYMLEQYKAMDRSVWIQELNLEPAQRLALLEFVRWNERPENKFYQYDYYRDNCSTRVRDALDRALGGQLRAALDTLPAGTTYRQETRRLLADDPLTYVGIQLGLGGTTDRPITVWEDAFLPMRLRDAVRDVKVRRADGSLGPLVAREERWFISLRLPEPETPPGFHWAFLGAGVLGAGVLLGLAAAARRGVGVARGGFAVLGAAWSLVAGLAGLLLLYGRAFTSHVAMWQNESALLFTPLSLLLVVLLPRLAFGRSDGRRATWVAALVALLAAVGAVVAGVTAVGPGALELSAAALPVHLAILLATMRLRAAAEPGPAPVPRPGDAPAVAGVS